MKKTKIQLEIKNCKDCSFFKEERVYTADSFERPFDWFCKKNDGKKIAGYVEWNDEKDMEVPEWCPIKVK